MPTFSDEHAKMIVVASCANPRLDPNLPGGGVTELHIEEVLKPHPFLKNRKVITMERYVPVKDPKRPPRFVVFIDLINDKPEIFRSIACHSAADVAKYVKDVLPLSGTTESELLAFCVRHLLHKEESIANDAFARIANLEYAVFRRAIRDVRAGDIAKLLRTPDLSPKQSSLLGFLLGHTGNRRYVDLFREKIKASEKNECQDLQSWLIGYTLLFPHDGYKKLCTNMADDNDVRRWIATMHVLRFFADHRRDVITEQQWTDALCLGLKGQLGDIAIDELRIRQRANVADQVFALWKEKQFQTPIYRRAIARYALAMPESMKARHFLQELRRSDPVFLQEMRQIEAPSGQ